MLRKESNTNVVTVAYGASPSVTAVEIDRALRCLAQRRAGLDVEEARWLRLAEAQKAWPKLGYVHAHEYLEDIFGYSPRTVTERLRVSKDLGELPELESALEAGELNYSCVRELTRVATPETVNRWLDAARDMNLREIERMVSGRCKGDDPESAPDPRRVKHGVWLELDAESLALFRQARAALDDELGERLDDKAFIAELGARLLSGTQTSCGAHCAKGCTPPPARTIHIAICPGCKRGWQDGAGVRVELDPNTIDLAECDAIIVDEDAGTRARSAIPPSTRRKVLVRAEHRCQVPGCRAARNLDIHHVRPRAEGGGHEPWNLIVLCGGHHRLRHEGALMITGRAPDNVVFERNGRRLLSGASFANLVPALSSATSQKSEAHHRALKTSSIASAKVVDATTALTQMGYKSSIAKRAVERACAHVGATAELPDLIREALRRCE